MIGADPLFYLRSKLGQWSGGKNTRWVDPAALAEYERCFADPATVHASCEDYRAAATIDLAHDAADQERRIACPLLVLWGERGLMHRNFDVLATWREKASGTVEGRALACGHYLPEERPAGGDRGVPGLLRLSYCAPSWERVDGRGSTGIASERNSRRQGLPQQHAADLTGRHRSAEVEALNLDAAFQLEKLQLLFGLTGHRHPADLIGWTCAGVL